MAITNAQQYKQLVNKPASDKRPGYKGRDRDYQQRGASKSDYAKTSQSYKDSGTQQVYDGSKNTSPKDSFVPTTPSETPKAPPKKPKKTKDNYKKSSQFTTPTLAAFNFLGNQLKNSKFGQYLNKKAREDYLENLKEDDPDLYQATVDDLAKLGYATRDVEIYGPKGKQDGPMAPGRDIETFTDLYEDQAKSILNTVTDSTDGGVGTLYDDYLDEKMNRFTPDNNGGNQVMDPCKGPNPPAYCNINNTTDPTDPRQILTTRILGSQFDPTFFANEGGRAALAEGGMPYEGGIMDLESGRQMYFLGKLVKKATRAVKKIAKSPIGKAALFAAPFAMSGSFGAGLGKFFGKGSLNPFLAKSIGGDTVFSGLGSILSKAGLVGKSGLPTLKGGLAFTSLLPFLAGKEEGDDFDIDAYYAANQLTPGTTKRQMGSEFDFYKYNLAEGGMPSKEPVAKKTMPLIDMDGQEMDLRAEGGFVPIGRMERADDVPARLSKNEFVFTADAVRNAGEGDIDKGAEVMYNMMKNLESGGEVSEESQGLNGAREMFQTSKRLEEVL